MTMFLLRSYDGGAGISPVLSHLRSLSGTDSPAAKDLASIADVKVLRRFVSGRSAISLMPDFNAGAIGAIWVNLTLLQNACDSKGQRAATGVGALLNSARRLVE